MILIILSLFLMNSLAFNTTEEVIKYIGENTNQLEASLFSSLWRFTVIRVSVSTKDESFLIECTVEDFDVNQRGDILVQAVRDTLVEWLTENSIELNPER
eukprot:TRINITY_DN878_c0_g1_i1.p1 TRINITY_DN878_c0_g1~~TRINITY_DN878_c0_g1_i1.p1  ORF type:complete len:100 (-),score=14.30 TRINITY_DN878_c0_g1_i1:705-1004(-)